MSESNANSSVRRPPVKGIKVARALNLASSTLRNYVRDGKIRGFIIGNKCWVDGDEAHRFGVPAD